MSIFVFIQYLNSGVLDAYIGQVGERPKSTWDMFYSCICSGPRLPSDIGSISTLCLVVQGIDNVFHKSSKFHAIQGIQF